MPADDNGVRYFTDRYDFSRYDSGQDWWKEARKDKGWSTGDRFKYKKEGIDAWNAWSAAQGQQSAASDASASDLRDQIGTTVGNINTTVGDMINKIGSSGYYTDWTPEGPVIRRTDTVNADGTTVQGDVLRDFTGWQDRIDELNEFSIPSFDQWSGDQGFDLAGKLGSIDTITSQLLDPTQKAADQAAARTNFQGQAGIDSNTMDTLWDEVSAGPEGQAGLSDQERRAYERAHESQMRSLERQGSTHLDQVMGAYGSSMRGLAAAESIRQQIGDAELQGRLGIIQEEQAQRQVQYDAKLQQYQLLLNAGQISEQQYMDGLRADRVAGLQSYASQVVTMVGLYSAESTALGQHAQVMLDTFALEMGVDQAVLDWGNQWFATELAPYTTKLAGQVTGLEGLLTGLNTQLSTTLVDQLS